MGRLDDAAKRKVVELREAGLSFRKIKAVLELENIKVSAQAIYLFLKEFHGRTRPKDSVPGGSGPSPASGLALAREVGLSEVRQSGWNEQQLRSLLREASRVTSYPSPTDSSGKIGVPQTRGQSSGTGKGGQEQQQEGDGKDEDVRIVSVTSLVQNAQHEGINTVRSGISAGTMATAFARRRFTPSPANPVLVARKRLLDKALLHRARVRDSGPQTSPQAVSLLRNQSCFTGADGRKVMLPQAASFEISTTRPPNVRGLHPGASLFRRGLLQRGNLPTRSPQQQQQQPRVGIRLPTPTQSSPTPQNPNSSVRAPAPPSQPSPPCQQSGADTAAPSGLQEQVKSLASEIRSLGLALRVIVEQQGRLEREQSQQTQVQKQILSTLQEVASKLGPCSLQHPPASTVPPCPFSSTSQSIYTSCSQAQPRFSEIDGSALENIEQFSLDGLGSASINGFQPCSTSDTLTFTQTHTPSFTQTHTPSFTQTQAQTYTPDGLSYTQSHTDTFTGLDNKSVEMASTSTDPTFQTSSSSAQASAPPISPHDAQLTIIKVENV